jgi:hypothetical protein
MERFVIKLEDKRIIVPNENGEILVCDLSKLEREMSQEITARSGIPSYKLCGKTITIRMEVMIEFEITP